MSHHESDRDFKCGECSSIFSTNKVLKRHLKVCNKDKVKCKYCPFSNDYECIVKKHIETTHLREYNDCDGCGKSELIIHYRNVCRKCCNVSYILDKNKFKLSNKGEYLTYLELIEEYLIKNKIKFIPDYQVTPNYICDFLISKNNKRVILTKNKNLKIEDKNSMILMKL
jgi:hypothetical protein